MIGSFSSESEGGQEQGEDSETPDLDTLTNNDTVLIKTEHSLYQFSITEPVLRQGKLSGGKLGDAARTAILVVSIREGANAEVSETPGLKTGTHVVFYLVSHNGMERLITSVVTDLTLIRDGKAWAIPVSSFNRTRTTHRTLIVQA